MVDLSNVQSKFVYGQRIDSGKQVITDFKSMGIVPTAIAAATRFGQNNRRLLGNWGISGR